jgi:3-hydroxymyristoyl/3-hydroxydecanoyl-(acyl carrier protein) dehydratase
MRLCGLLVSERVKVSLASLYALETVLPDHRPELLERDKKVKPAIELSANRLVQRVGDSVKANVAVKSVAVKLVAVKPVAVKPVAVKPVVVKPVAVKPVAVKPVVVKPVAVVPLIGVSLTKSASAAPQVAQGVLIPSVADRTSAKVEPAGSLREQARANIIERRSNRSVSVQKRKESSVQKRRERMNKTMNDSHEKTLSEIISGFNEVEESTAQAHQDYLKVVEQSLAVMADAVSTQMEMIAAVNGMPADFSGSHGMPMPQSGIDVPFTGAGTYGAGASGSSGSFYPPNTFRPLSPVLPEPPCKFNFAQCQIIADGRISEVYGPDFNVVDTYPTRVRLPSGPLNFVDRIMEVEGEQGYEGKEKLSPGRMVTEHDIRPDSWYLDNGRIPTGVSVEAGQADLCLSGYLGIDFKTKGKAMYRLLDAVVTFHDHLPVVGDTIHYDIRGVRFIRQADTYLYFFEYDGTVNGKPYITMRNGCAGFFTPEQLDAGKGLILGDGEMDPIQGKFTGGYRPLVKFDRVESLDDDAVTKLIEGDIAGCFGPEFAGLNIGKPLTFPGGMMRLIHRVPEINPTGGRAGLGLIRAEIDVPYDAWYLTNHFCDDQVMPGTLMYESCMQAWRVFLLRMGWIVEQTPEVIFEPVPEVRSGLRCRGQVVPGTKQCQYEIHIKEIGYNPEPYAMADAVMYADGREMVYCSDMSIKLSGVSQQQLESIWGNRMIGVDPRYNQPVDMNVCVHADNCGDSGFVSKGQPVVSPGKLPAIYTKEQILEYCEGAPSKCFGEPYKPFDDGRFLARLPRPPYLCLDRITYVEGKPFELKAGGALVGQMDISPHDWFFRANRQTSIPYCVILEYPLQICGWYAAYCGSALAADHKLQFRNLDGNAILHKDLDMNAGTLSARIRFTGNSSSGGMIIQKYDFKVYQNNECVYEGDTVFGFFTEQALSMQVGVRGAKPYEPTAAEKQRAIPYELIQDAPITPDDMTDNGERGLTMPSRCYQMNDRVELFIPDGGPNGLGFVRAVKEVRPDEWFFYAHFYQDPVIPGSLGLEAFIQLMKVTAIHRWGAEFGKTHRFEPIAVGRKHTWAYRGQVVQTNKLVTCDCVIDKIEDDEKVITASGFLKADGKIIYEMKNFAIRVVPM